MEGERCYSVDEMNYRSFWRFVFDLQHVQNYLLSSGVDGTEDVESAVVEAARRAEYFNGRTTCLKVRPKTSEKIDGRFCLKVSFSK